MVAKKLESLENLSFSSKTIEDWKSRISNLLDDNTGTISWSTDAFLWKFIQKSSKKNTHKLSLAVGRGLF